MRIRKGTPEPIAELIKHVVEDLQRAKKTEIAKISSCWPELAGRKIARHTKPVSLRKGTLLVHVGESAWFYQANLQKEKLLQAVQKKTGKDKVQDIQFRMGSIR